MADEDVYPPDEDTDIGAMRVLIPDAEQLPNQLDRNAPPTYMFSDSDLRVYLRIGRGNPIRGAAFACRAIGQSEAIISKVITTEDLATNGASMLNAFNNTAQILFGQAKEADAEDEDGGMWISEFYIQPLECEPF